MVDSEGTTIWGLSVELVWVDRVVVVICLLRGIVVVLIVADPDCFVNFAFFDFFLYCAKVGVPLLELLDVLDVERSAVATPNDDVDWCPSLCEDAFDKVEE